MRRSPTHPAGFTLIELTAVIILVGILAATAIPTITRLRAVHEASLAQEVARRLTVARAHATTTGIPTGLSVDLNQQRMPFLVIGPQGIEERNAGIDNLAALRSDRLANIGNATVTAHTIPNAQGNSPIQQNNTIWFDYQGTPHLRFDNGNEVRPLEQTVTITIGQSNTVIVQPSTGHIAIRRGAAL